MQQQTSALYGCEGLQLSSWERGFFKEQRPWGYIIFGRNISDPEQLRALTSSLREASDDPDAPIFVDQEGGLVARLKGPHFRHPPAPRRFAELAEQDLELAAEAAWLNARLMADDLKGVGVNANCAPMLDVVQPDAHQFLQERALGQTADIVEALGRATALGLRDGGVAPCIKHAPGHGRGDADSHLNLPVVNASRDQLEDVDFAPFRALRKEAMMMTGHILFPGLDPDHPATLSSAIINGIIRTQWGYDGLILTDDINMEALGGSIGERSQKALAAGCEIICHCNGKREDMEAVANAAVALSGATKARADRARAIAQDAPKPFEKDAAEERLKSLGLWEART